MPKCIIQFGLARVSSGPVQQALATLDTEDFYYARLGENLNHGPAVHSLFAAEPGNHPLYRQRQMPPKALKALIAAAEQGLANSHAIAGARTLILSAGSLPMLDTPELEGLKAWFAALGREVHLCVYLRSPADFVTRHLCDNVMAGAINTLDVEPLFRDVGPQINKFDAVFGAGRVTCRVLDRAVSQAGGIAADFINWAGITGITLPPEQERAMPARDAVALLAQLHFYAAAKGIAALKPEEARHVFKLLNDYKGPDFSLAPELFESLYAKHRSEIEATAKRAGVSFDQPAASSDDVHAIEALMTPVPAAAMALLSALRPNDRSAAKSAADDLGALVAGLRVEKVKAATPRPAPPASKPAVPGKAAPVPPRPVVKPAVPLSSNPHINRILEPAEVGVGPTRTVPATLGPRPLINHERNLIVFWSAKTACTTAYVWFSHISGFSDVVRAYASWPHRHRQEQYQKSKLYAESVGANPATFQPLRIIRDPYSRAVSIYRHALQTHFADKDLQQYSKGSISADKGYSFQTFLDFVAALDMNRVDIHFRPQRHPFESAFAALRVINISKQDLFTELNAFETDNRLPKTDFEDLNWLHHLESKRKAKQDPMEGDALDTVPFSRHQVARLGMFPSYNQLLTPEARRKIEAIYKADFDAYRAYL